MRHSHGWNPTSHRNPLVQLVHASDGRRATRNERFVQANNASLTDPHYACTDDRPGSLSCRRKCSPMYLHLTVAVYRWLSQNRGAAPEKRVHRFREGMRFLLKEHRTANRYLRVRTVQAQVQHKALWYVVLDVPYTVTLLSGRSPMSGLRQPCCT